MAGGSKLWAKYNGGCEIGAGEHSKVCILVRKSDGKRFACKSTRIDMSSSKECAATMKRVQVEVECLSKMKQHGGVVHYEEMIMDPDAWHLIMELCDCSLGDWIRERGKIPELEAAMVVRDLASTLKDLHAAGIMHRDVKPDNILISGASTGSNSNSNNNNNNNNTNSRDDDSSSSSSTSAAAAAAAREYHVKFADFGIAECVCCGGAGGGGGGGPGKKQQLKDKVGTPRYVAPEVICGSYWLPADIWSLGVTLYQMLAGTSKVFSDYSTLGLLSDLKACEVTADTCLDWDGISTGARDLIQKMMHKNPYKRPKPADILQHPWIVAAATAVAANKTNAAAAAAEQQDGGAATTKASAAAAAASASASASAATAGAAGRIIQKMELVVCC